MIVSPPRFCLLFMLMVAGSFLQAQQPAPDTAIAEIYREGKLLYRLEMAAWYGSELILKKFKDRASDITGYITYPQEDRTICVLLSGKEEQKVVASVSFDSSYRNLSAKIDSERRELTAEERLLAEMRRLAISQIQSDSLFRQVPQTRFNLVPLIQNNQRKLYILSGPTEDGIMVFGNDYFIRFDEDLKILEKRKLHKSVAVLEYGNQLNPERQPVGSIHSHSPETGEYITATDICTLMLYGRFTTWEQHYVMGPTMVSIWDCQAQSLEVMSQEQLGKRNEQHSTASPAKRKRQK